jgi:hypothetical protein
VRLGACRCSLCSPCWPAGASPSGAPFRATYETQRETRDVTKSQHQCFGSALTVCGSGSGSSFLSECGSGSGSSFENECGSGFRIQVRGYKTKIFEQDKLHFIF